MMMDDTTKLQLTWIDHIQNRLIQLKNDLKIEFSMLYEDFTRYRKYY